jgi:hypothetical protein
MSYRLKVRARAKRSLAAIWLSAADPGAVTRANDRLERRLQNDPLTIGESRVGRIRVAVFKPLVAFYSVDQAAHRVVLLDIRTFRPRP